MQEHLQLYLATHIVLAPFLFVLLRMLPILIPPIPGFLVDALGIVLFPWYLGFVLAVIGGMLGAVGAFYVSRHFREPLLRRFRLLQKIHRWEDHYSEKQKFWGLFLLRLTTAPFFDYISYAAGLTHMSVRLFVTTTFFGSVLPFMFVMYYFGRMSYRDGIWAVAGFIASLALVLWLLKRRSRTRT